MVPEGSHNNIFFTQNQSSTSNRMSGNNRLTSSSTPASTQATYESCVAHLTGGKQVHELSVECQRILGAASGVLTRRNSGAWSSKDGHDARQYTSPGVGGVAHDAAKGPGELSISEIYLQNKSPEDQKLVKQKIARTASRGGKVRTDDVVSVEEVEREAARLAHEQAESKKTHPKV